ncbi:type IX secretion system membrane protein PorP/SprF [Flavobacterium sp. N502540]|uniref:PorP/SprF family type IX secretion system membrane protein n=1 Tax=Flavobacterium sp. N502540 TaxID=2986838 RepID=UPI002224908A|nr:type IX secretion system membrane protein PorP/SprF [Flavobacterium sp. N502540]
MRKLFLFFIIYSTIGFAQQDSQFTQYMYNTLIINPAYAGSKGTMSIFGLYRTQWVGLEGAPKTGSFSLHTPLNDSKLGIGGSLVNDKIGPTDESILSVDLSYTIPTSASFNLSFGIRGTGNLFSLDQNKLSPELQGDLQFQNLKSVFTPNMGVGLYWYSDKAYIGLSIPNFIENNRYNDNNISIFKNKICYYLIGGYVFDLSPSIKFKPAVLTKMSTGSSLQIDLSANFMYNEKFVFGAGYRSNAAVSALAGFQITEGLFLGYAYDFDTTALRNYNSGSHEIFLRFELFNNSNNKGLMSPRFF